MGNGCVDLTNVKEKSREAIYPSFTNSTICTLLMLTNLAEPDWIQVNCSDKLLTSVFCITDNHYHHSMTDNLLIIKDKSCSSSSVLKKQQMSHFFMASF